VSVSATVQDRDLSTLSSQELMRLERSTAEEFMGGLPWGSIAWAFTNLAVWLSLWPLTLSGMMPLWATAPIATLNVILAYLPSHEAQHRIIAREGERLFWLNELVGRRFRIGNVECLGTKLCEPCLYLAELLGKPILAPLVHRGGLRAQILTGGEIAVGDAVVALD